MCNRKNQDAMLTKYFATGELFAAVADGVGGEKGGEIASHLAIECAAKYLIDTFPTISFDETVANIVQVFKEKALKDNALTRMATTLSLVIVDKNKIHFAHIGDSRIYHLRNYGIRQITEDQTEVALLIKKGILSINRAKNYARKSILISAISADGHYELVSGYFDICSKDRILLVTDGVYGLISKKEIRDLSTENPNLTEFVASVSRLLSLKGQKDDATMIAIDVL